MTITQEGEETPLSFKKWGWEDDMMTNVIKKKSKEHGSCSAIPGVNAHSNSLRRVKKKKNISLRRVDVSKKKNSDRHHQSPAR